MEQIAQCLHNVAKQQFVIMKDIARNVVEMLWDGMKRHHTGEVGFAGVMQLDIGSDNNLI